MKITICGSTAFILEMEAVAKQLENLGHAAKFPPVKFTDGDGKEWHTLDYYKFKKSEPFNNPDFLRNHTQRIRDHFELVQWSDAVLITNYDKNNIKHYIGPNTLMEMGLAFHLGKKIYLLNPVPELAWKEEILGLRSIVIHGQLENINLVL
jgi:hypothetical protein